MLNTSSGFSCRAEPVDGVYDDEPASHGLVGAQVLDPLDFVHEANIFTLDNVGTAAVTEMCRSSMRMMQLQ